MCTHSHTHMMMSQRNFLVQSGKKKTVLRSRDAPAQNTPVSFHHTKKKTQNSYNGLPCKPAPWLQSCPLYPVLASTLFPQVPCMLLPEVIFLVVPSVLKTFLQVLIATLPFLKNGYSRSAIFNLFHLMAHIN